MYINYHESSILTPFFLPNKESLWTSAAGAAPTHKIICCSEKCKTKCYIFGLLSVTSVKCTHGWIAPIYFLEMVKMEEIVTILEHFQWLFLLLFLLNGENAFILYILRGKYSKCFVLPLVHISFSYLPLKKGGSSVVSIQRESRGRERRKPEMQFILE